MTDAMTEKCRTCGHLIVQHTYSDDYQGCDETKCGCSFNLGDEYAKLRARLDLLEAVAKAAKILVAAENRNDYTSYQSRYTIIRQAKESVEAALEAYEAAKG